MTAAWSEQLPDRRAADRKALLQFFLASLGAVAVLGSVFGTCWGWMRAVQCVCCDEEGASE